VLSESSLFINKRRLLIKTCGTTTLLNSVQPFIEAAFKFCGFDSIQDVFYSRKKFMRPELQKSPHTSFEEEVNLFSLFSANYLLFKFFKFSLII
jgi:S-adenosylmethionine decarboxylase